MDFTINTEDDRAALMEYVTRLPLPGHYVVKVERRRRKRTVKQNRMYRLWLSCMAHETGNDAECLHRYFARKFLGVEFENVFDYNVEKPISTKRLTTAQFTEYLGQVEAFAAGEGIVLPHPEDLMYEVMEERYGTEE